MILHSIEEALAEARRIKAAPDADLTRAATALSVRGICSLAVLATQLDEICRAAAAVPMSLDQAAFVMTPGDLALFADLQERLAAAGYLPLQATPAAQEARDGAR